MYQNYVKRWGDIVVAGSALLALSPIFIVVTIALAMANEGKPFFVQVRPGRKERLFKIVKFKTMNDKKDASGNLLPDALRLTKIGAFIRKTSIDEIPQLLNVVRGDMSLVGPRPLLPEYLPLYNQEQLQRHHVRPGITGWAQVNGRNAISWEEKFKLDVWYVHHQSFWLDLKIIVKTVKKVLISEGITDTVNATTTKFHGNKKP